MPFTTQTPYLIGLEPNVTFTALLSVGDQVGFRPNGTTPWRMVGIPDGLGAFDNGNGTITVLMNHEIGNTVGIVRDHGSIGSFVSALTVDKTTLEVTAAEDLGKVMYQDNDGDGVYTQATSALSRLCSADLAPVSAFFFAGADGIVGTADDVGTQSRIFLNGEESGANSRAWAWIATGTEKGNVYELPGLGNLSFENVVANPFTGAKTVVMVTDDSTPGQVYVYVGDKQATGTEVQKAGLVGGKLYGIVASGIGNSGTTPGTAENQIETDGNPATIVPTSGTFTIAEITSAATRTGAQIQTDSNTAGVTEWWRPEDGAWDTINHNRFYFVTTATQTAPSRLWALDFTDAANPTLGGTFTMLLDGTEGQVMFDNIGVDADGIVTLCEDPGTFAAAAKVWQYNPVTDTLSVVAKHDPARFGDTVPGGGTIAATAPFNTDEESSGVVDVTSLLGNATTKAYLIDTQAHYLFGASGSADRTELVEGGQLMLLRVETPHDGGRGDDALNGGYTDDSITGQRGNDTIRGGSGKDTLLGAAGDDSIDGGTGDDVLGGGAGNDAILGGAGDDRLTGAAGSDTLTGGAGNDTLVGGADADWFVFGSAAEGIDRIQGFEHGVDHIVVSAAGFGGGLVAGGAAAVNTAATASAGGGAQFIYLARGGALIWDADGDGAGVQIATITGRPVLDSGDIIISA